MFKIYTLGNFDIKYNDQSILDSRGYPYKTLKLFKYFLTHEGEMLLPEKIIEDILEPEEYKDPNGALRTQISRVRSMIGVEETSFDSFFSIEHIKGYYLFELEEACILDIREFQEKIKILKSDEMTKEDEKILTYAMSLYQGRYLEELKYEDWVIPIRSRIDRLYIKALVSFLQKLKEKNRYDEILSICENAMQHNFYEETIHTYFLDALMNLDQKSYALSHYEFYTTKFYHDLDVSPSIESREIYKKICGKKTKNEELIDLNRIEDILKEDNMDGALICDSNYFKFLYKIKARNRERKKNSDICLGIITIEGLGYKALGKDELKLAMDSLQNIMLNTLRKGDVLSQWNDKQLVFLLYNIEDIDLDLDCIMDRLNSKIEIEKKNLNVDLNIKCKKI